MGLNAREIAKAAPSAARNLLILPVPACEPSAILIFTAALFRQTLLPTSLPGHTASASKLLLGVQDFAGMGI